MLTVGWIHNERGRSEAPCLNGEAPALQKRCKMPQIDKSRPKGEPLSRCNTYEILATGGRDRTYDQLIKSHPFASPLGMVVATLPFLAANCQSGSGPEAAVH